MDDEQRKAQWAKVTDLREAVGIMLAESEFVGTDPYYRDLNDALWEMLERAYEASK
jgi:hypothetical protein